MVKEENEGIGYKKGRQEEEGGASEGEEEREGQGYLDALMTSVYSSQLVKCINSVFSYIIFVRGERGGDIASRGRKRRRDKHQQLLMMRSHASHAHGVRAQQVDYTQGLLTIDHHTSPQRTNVCPSFTFSFSFYTSLTMPSSVPSPILTYTTVEIN